MIDRTMGNGPEELRPAPGKAAPATPTVSEGSSDELLDPAIIDSLRELGDDDFSLTELRETFAETARATIQELQEALHEEDGAKVRALAHRLKGSGGSMGARRMALMCRELENHADGELNAAAATMTLEQLRDEFDSVLSALAEALP